MKRKFWAAVAAAVVATPAVGFAQFAGGPGVPAVPPAAVPVVPVAAAPAGVAAPGPRVGFFQRAKTNFGNCIQNLLSSPLGQLLNNATKPLSALTGGIIGPLEKPPTADDTKKPGVAGAAALGKKDAAEAAARRANVKYLGTLDCRYYPEASKGLADALRTDPSECVRYEAAVALNRGCCCNQITIAALTASVSGYDTDGNPGERSARVRCTAAAALARCLSCYVPPAAPSGADAEKDDCGKKKEEKKPVKEKETEKETEKTDEKKDKPADLPAGKLTTGPFATPTKTQVQQAREVLEAFQETFATTEALYGTQAASGSKSVFGILEASAAEPRPAAAVVNTAAYTAPVARTTPARTPDAAAVAKKPANPSWQPNTTAAVPPAGGVTRAKFTLDEKAPPRAVVPAVEPAVIPPPPAEPPTATVAPPPPLTTTADAQAVEQLIHKVLLGDSAADQHAAIRELVRYDWATHPLVASCLVAGAKSSASAAVRVDCIRHLAHHQMAHKDVLAALGELTTDADSWVRDEAQKAADALKK